MLHTCFFKHMYTLLMYMHVCLLCEVYDPRINYYEWYMLHAYVLLLFFSNICTLEMYYSHINYYEWVCCLLVFFKRMYTRDILMCMHVLLTARSTCYTSAYCAHALICMVFYSVCVEWLHVVCIYMYMCLYVG